MDYQWHLIWHSRKGSKDIGSFNTLVEADKMKTEFIKAFGGSIEIKKRRTT